MIEGLASADLAAVILDSDGRASVVTPQAEALFDKDFSARGGQLWASDPVSQSALADLSQRARRPDRSMLVPDVVIHRPHGRRPILVQAVRVGATGLDALPGARLLLLLTDLDAPRRVKQDALRHLFGLSRAEADIAAQMALGLDAAEIVDKRKVALETVRAQIKTLFRKLDVHCQSEVVRLVARLAGGKRVRARLTRHRGDHARSAWWRHDRNLHKTCVRSCLGACVRAGCAADRGRCRSGSMLVGSMPVGSMPVGSMRAGSMRAGSITMPRHRRAAFAPGR